MAVVAGLCLTQGSTQVELEHETDSGTACSSPDSRNGKRRGDALTHCALTVSSESLVQAWSMHIRKAERPNPMSPRDGKLLKILPQTQRLCQLELEASLRAAIESHLQHEAEALLQARHSKGRHPFKADVALMRAQAYIAARQFDIALRDAQVALAYGPQHAGGSSSWAWAWATRSAALEGLYDNTGAALDIQHAIELQPSNGFFKEGLARLLNRIPEDQAVALQAGDSQQLEQLLAEQAEEAKPEFLRKRPKYFHYYQWMRERLHACCGELPAPVEDKLLALDATELDMLLTHPKGIQQQAQKLVEVMEAKGAQYLKSYRLPRLTWQEYKTLKAECPAVIEDDPDASRDLSARLLAAAEQEAQLQETPICDSDQLDNCRSLTAVLSDFVEDLDDLA